MATYRFGEVVLIAFPFTDASGTKRRPALVLLDTGDADILVARVTSQPSHKAHDVELTSWKQAGLLTLSFVRVDKLATLEKTLVQRRLGVISASDQAKIRQTFRSLAASIG